MDKSIRQIAKEEGLSIIQMDVPKEYELTLQDIGESMSLGGWKSKDACVHACAIMRQEGEARAVEVDRTTTRILYADRVEQYTNGHKMYGDIREYDRKGGFAAVQPGVYALQPRTLSDRPEAIKERRKRTRPDKVGPIKRRTVEVRRRVRT